MKHFRTPGPWNVDAGASGEDIVFGADGSVVAQALGTNFPANARLIAAAPELLAALKAMVLNDKHTYRDCDKAALAAIAKAEG